MIKKVPNLVLLETIDSDKLALKLNNALASLPSPHTLDVYIQVITSDEDTKYGIAITDLNELLSFIKNNCKYLNIIGLMTIGAPGDISCFDRLAEARDIAATFLGVEANTLALSMGMSGDFEEAIAHGATSIRVGSTIFGARDYTAK